LKAEPASIGTISPATVRLRSAALISSSVNASPFRYFSVSSGTGVGHRLDHVVVPLVGHRLQVGRDVLVAEVHALAGVVPFDGAHLDQVDHALELVLGADRHLDRHGIALQPVLDLLLDAEEIGADAVHLVDEGDARHLVLVRLAPHGFRLRLHAADRVVHHHGAVQHAHRALDLDGEVDVARGVDDVDAVLRQIAAHAFPEGRGGGRGDGDAAFLFLLHPVHRRRAIVHLADLVIHAGVEQDALGRGGLACVDVGADADVAVTLDGGFTAHHTLLEHCMYSCGKSQVRRLAVNSRANSAVRLACDMIDGNYYSL
jgi:hypothetical protein